jgi:hypothetical protein
MGIPDSTVSLPWQTSESEANADTKHDNKEMIKRDNFMP